MLTFITFSIWAQNPLYPGKFVENEIIFKNLINNSIYIDKGIFKTFDDFKYNNPYSDLNFKICAAKIFSDRDYVLEYYDTEKEKWKRYEESFWGYCDGSKIFFSRDFYELIELGPYCIFEKEINSTYYIQFGQGSPYSRFENHMYLHYVFDIHTGDRNILTKKLLREILQADKELLEKFKNEKQKKEKLVSYIRRYNRRNPIK
jgi:hypothetical protein